MKGVTFLLVILVLAVNISYSQNPVSGTVMFKDNHETVNAGKVKAYNLNGVLVAQTSINANGTYLFEALPGINLDLIGVPNIGPDDDDFIPTIYPEVIDWQYAVPVLPVTPLTGINIYVERGPGGNAFGSFISGVITLDNSPIKDAVVYAKQNNQIFGFGITNDRGEYEISSLPQGDYILVVHRIGASSATRNVNLTMEGLTNVIFNLEEAPFILSDNIAPQKFELSQNYPNPFNPATKINYSVPVQGKVKLSVYNSTGQLVDVLVNEVQASGSYSVSFNGSNLSSGVYMYRMETEGFNQTKKMILVK